MSYLSVKQMQVVFKAFFLDGSICRRIKLCTLAAVFQVDFVDISHKLYCLSLAYVLIERAAELICNIVLAVGECACAAEAAHYSADRAFNAGFYLFAVNGAFTLFERIAKLKHGNFQILIAVYKLIG